MADATAPGKTSQTPDPKRVKKTSGTAPPALSLSPTSKLPLSEAAKCIVTQFQTKSTRQLHDEALHQGLEARYIPTVIIKIISDYVQELSLQPFELDGRRKPTVTPSNQAIANEINAIFVGTDRGSRLMQGEIIETHSRHVLDYYFTNGITAAKRRQMLKAILAKNSEALTLRRKELRAITHYLTDSDCEKYLQQEIDGPGARFSDQDEMHRLQDFNVKLFFEALRKFQPGLLSEKTRQHELELKWAGCLLKRASALVEKGQPAPAYGLLLQALNSYCRLHEKRKVIESVLHFIELAKASPQNTVQEMKTLFSIAKNLCLLYPADPDLYAKLLFAMDDRCQERFEVDMARQLYQQAEADQLSLLRTCQAKFLYRQIRSDYRTGLGHQIAMQRINSALDYCLDLLQTTRAKGYTIDPVDLDRYELFHSMALLYRLAAEITVRVAGQIEQMNEPQRAAWLVLIKHDRGVEHFFSNFSSSHDPALIHNARDVNPKPGVRILSVCTAYYKNALKSLLGQFNAGLNAPGKQLFVLIFGELVDFYRNSKDREALELLLHKKNIGRFTRWDEFKMQLPVWRKVLRNLKKGQC